MLALTMINLSWSQERTCNCSEAFSDMTVKLEANYIGLKHFYERGKRSEYEQRKTEFTKLSSNTDASQCTQVLGEFLSYFDDGHLFVFERPKYAETEIDAMRRRIQTGKLDVDQVEALLKLQSRMTGTGEGDKIIGRYSDATSEFAMVKDGDSYNGYILQSTNENVSSGELKVTLKWTGEAYRGVYYSYGHEVSFTKGQLYKEGTLLKLANSRWARIDSEFEREEAMFDFENGIDQPTIQKLDDDNVLFSIPSYNLDYQQFMSFLKKNEKTLLNARNLIFDIRGNTGGNAIYFPFFDLFSDRIMPGGQGHVLASADNLAYFERNVQFSAKIYKPVVKDIQEHMGEIVDGPAYLGRTVKRNKKSKVENVAILTDEGCMSAAESFILHAKGISSKVTTFGSPTFGMIDYTSVNASQLNSGNQHIYFGYPTSTFHKEIPENGYNKTGIVPDVPIARNVEDKVAYIMQHYKQDK